MASSQQINYNFTGNTKNLENSIDRAIGLLGKYDNAAAALTAKMNGIFRVVAGLGIGAALEKSVRQSINYVENLNLFTVAMGKSVDAGKRFVSQLQEIYGMDPNNVMRYTATFNELAVAIDAPAKAAENMSLGLTKMGTDISSLFNIPIDTVMENLTSGMQGMTRAVRKYGVDLRVVTLQQTAYGLGLKGLVNDMTEADRMGLRYITLLRQTANAQGDLAKTIETPANQLRILGEQISQLARSIGNLLIGSVAAVLPYINGFVMAIRQLITAIGSLLGFKEMGFGGATDAASALKDQTAGIGSAAEKSAKKLKSLTAPMDELNIIKPPEKELGSGGAIDPEMGAMNPAIAAELERLQQKMESVRMKANEVRDAILGFMGIDLQFDPEGKIVGYTFNLQALKDNIMSLSGINITPLITSFDSLKAALAPFTQTIFAGLKWFWDNILVPIGKWAAQSLVPAFLDLLAGALRFLNPLLQALAPLGEWLYNGFLKPIATWTGGAIIDILHWLSQALTDIGDWISKNQTAVQNIAIAIGSFAAAWGLVNLAIGVWNVIGVIATGITTAFGAAVAFLTSPIGLVVLAIGAVIAIVVLLIRNWTTVQTVAANVWSGIVKIWGAVSNWFTTNVLNPIVNVFTTVWNSITSGFTFAFNFIKAGIKAYINGYIYIIEGFVNGIIAGVNFIIRAINSISFTVPDWVPIIGGKSVGFNIPQLTPINLPKLATGGVVTGPTTAVIGEGAYDEAVIPLGNSPQLAELISKLTDSVVSAMGGEINLKTELNLDGEKIYTNQQKIARDRGYNFGMGVFAR